MQLVRLFLVFAKYNLKRELEFRLNAFLSLLTYLGWFSLTFIGIELIFGQINLVAGWSREEVYLLSAVYLLFLSLTKMVYHHSLDKLGQAIRSGYFDFWLLKPVPTRLIASVSRFEWSQFVRSLVSLVVIQAILRRFEFQPSLSQWLQFLVIFVSGYLALYSVIFISATTSIWLINLFNLSQLWDEIYNLGNRPAQIYRGFLEPVFFIIVPVALIAALPTQALLGNLAPVWILAGPFTAAALLFISQGFWRFALTHYASASS